MGMYDNPELFTHLDDSHPEHLLTSQTAVTSLVTNFKKL
jgi:hypothetical protein